LKFKVILIKNPDIKITRMEYFIVGGIIKICVEDEIHIIRVPLKMEYGAIIISGVSIIIMFENMLSDFIFIIDFIENLNIRIEYIAVIPMDKIII